MRSITGITLSLALLLIGVLLPLSHNHAAFCPTDGSHENGHDPHGEGECIACYFNINVNINLGNTDDGLIKAFDALPYIPIINPGGRITERPTDQPLIRGPPSPLS